MLEEVSRRTPGGATQPIWPQPGRLHTQTGRHFDMLCPTSDPKPTTQSLHFVDALLEFPLLRCATATEGRGMQTELRHIPFGKACLLLHNRKGGGSPPVPSERTRHRLSADRLSHWPYWALEAFSPVAGRHCSQHVQTVGCQLSPHTLSLCCCCWWAPLGSFCFLLRGMLNTWSRIQA